MTARRNQRKSRMVEISSSGSGEGPGWETGRGYSTVEAAREAALEPSAARRLAARRRNEDAVQS